MIRSHKIPDANIEFLEATKRLYRGAMDVAKKLDEKNNNAVSIVDIFTPENEVLRAKLKDYCERLLFKDPVGHAKKIEELLWRRGFYDVVSTAKRLKKTNVWSNFDKSLISTHLSVGVGFYHHLILRLYLEYELDLAGLIDFAYPQNDCYFTSQKNNNNYEYPLINSLQKLSKEDIKQCSMKIVHRSLVCLGDLARYKLEFDVNWDPMISMRYYKMAITIEPNFGMPHNQLGTLAGNKNYGIDAVYYYLRSTLCLQPFDGAEGNLKRIITTNIQKNIHNNNNTLPSSQLCAQLLFKLLNKWNISNNNNNNNNIATTSSAENIENTNEICQILLDNIENSLKIDKSQYNKFNNTDNMSEQVSSIDEFLKNLKIQDLPYLTDDVMLKIVSICLMLISKLQKNNLPQLNQVIAFMLSVLSKLIQVTIIRLEISIDKLLTKNKNSKSIADDIDVNHNENSILNNNKSNIDNNHPDKNLISNGNGSVESKKTREKSKSLLSKLRRPRKRINSSDSDISEIGEFEDDDDDDTSSEEYNSDDSQQEDGFSEVSYDPTDDDDNDDEEDEEEEKDDKKISKNSIELESTSKNNNFIEKNEETINDNQDKNNIIKDAEKLENSMTQHDDTSLIKNKNNLNLNDYILILSNEGLLQSIKICFDWLQENNDILKLALKGSHLLLHRISNLLNLINITADEIISSKNILTESMIFSNQDKLKKYLKLVPLPEDIDLRGLNVLNISQKNINWKILRNIKINNQEATLLRSLKILDFANFLCEIDESGLKFNEIENEYFVVKENQKDSSPSPSPPTLIVDENIDNLKIINTKDQDNEINNDKVDLDNTKGKLMRNMGELWLKAEVKALESRLNSKLMSPYLVPDHEALAKHTPLLKRLVYTKKFIIVIPSIVVSALDELKRASSNAREATRWLEEQFRKGSRFLRAQRPQEHLPLPYIKGPRPKDKEAWVFFQIIECCHYLQQQTTKGGHHNDSTQPPIVTLLTGINGDERKSSSTFSPDGLAQSAGVNLEHIESFHTKWKTSSKSHG